jgi:DNA sulfur modification protein DndE
MLPNKLRISESTTNTLRRLQNNTGLTVNIGARLAFFSSIESGFRFNPDIEIVEHTGRELDVFTWLGEHRMVVELLLAEQYPSLSKQQLHDAWTSHVDKGAKHLEQKNTLVGLIVAF